MAIQFVVAAVVCIAVVFGAVDEPTAETLKFQSVSFATIRSSNGLQKLTILSVISQDNNPDGTFEFAYETSNGIVGQSSGSDGKEIGERSWIAPDGTPVKFSYVADENGFQPTGDHLPQPPAHIARLVQWLVDHPSDDDGSYKPQ